MCQTALRSRGAQMGRKTALSSNYVSPLSLAFSGDGKTENKANPPKYMQSLILYISCNFGLVLAEDLKSQFLSFRSPRQGLWGRRLTVVTHPQVIGIGQPQTLVGRLAYRSSELMMKGCEGFVIAQAPL